MRDQADPPPSAMVRAAEGLHLGMSEDAANPPADEKPEHGGAETAPTDGDGDDAMAAAALAAATAAVDELSTEATGTGTKATGTNDGEASPLPLPSFSAGSSSGGADGLDLLDDVSLDIRVELGRTVMMVEDVLKLGEGAVVELDKLAGDPVDIYANGRHIARGEVLVLNDNFCIRVNEIVAAHADEDQEEEEADAA